MPSWDVLLGWGVDNVALHRAEGISRPEVHGVLSAGHGEKNGGLMLRAGWRRK